MSLSVQPSPTHRNTCEHNTKRSEVEHASLGNTSVHISVSKSIHVYSTLKREQPRKRSSDSFVFRYSVILYSLAFAYISHCIVNQATILSKIIHFFYGIIKWFKGHFILHFSTFRRWWFHPCLMFDITFHLKCFSKIYCITGWKAGCSCLLSPKD